MEQQAYHHPYTPHAAMGAAPAADDPVLLARLRAQVEFYFSPQNLARDVFLRGILEQNENAVSVETIASFPKVRELHAIGRLGMMNMPLSAMPPADPMLLCRALEGSLVVTVSSDGQWIHLGGTNPEPLTNQQQPHQHGKATPNQESFHANEGVPPSSPSSPSTTASSAGVPTHPITIKERTTVILHDAPEGTTVQDVMALFSTLYFRPKSAAAKSDDGASCWEVDFVSESDAVAALSNTQNETIHGMPIRASLKNAAAAPPHADYAQMPSVPPQQQQHYAPPQHQQPHYHPQQYAPPQQQHHHPQEHQQQQYIYPPTVMQGYAVYEYHPYYGVPVVPQQQQQQQVHYGYGAPPVHYVNNNNMFPPQVQQQQQQHGMPPPNSAAYAQHGFAPQHHAPMVDNHYHHQQQQHSNKPYYNNKKKKGKGKGGNYNNRDYNYDRSNNNYDRQGGDRSNGEQRPNNNYHERSSNNKNDSDDTTTKERPRDQNERERAYRQDKANDIENVARADRNEHAAAAVQGNTDADTRQDATKKKYPRKNKKKNRPSDLGQENFPSLVENGTTSKKKQSSKAAAAPSGYAAALKKKTLPLTLAPPTPSGESTAQTEQLEKGMSNLNVSKQTVEPEFWQASQDDAPDIW